MNKAQVRKFRPGTAEYVVMHARWQASRGRQPSATFCGIDNPVRALALATRMAYFPENGEYLRGVELPNYKCSDCGASNCKLWRLYQSCRPELLCADCAAKDQKKDISNIDEHGRIPCDTTGSGRTDQIGWYIPAVPIEDGETYWGYTSVPEAGCEWWRKLTTKPVRIHCVSVNELNSFGCPSCGYRSGYMPLSGGVAGVWQCGDCGESCCVLAEGITKSTIGFGRGSGPSIYPELQPHPRRGIPAHGRPDKKPEGGGEFFHPRGIGLDTCTCFVCDLTDRNTMLNNIAAFVQCKDAGERVVEMFGHGARMDYRDHEPDRVQVKVGACDKHLPNLKKLFELTERGTITDEMIRSAREQPSIQQ